MYHLTLFNQKIKISTLNKQILFIISSLSHVGNFSTFLFSFSLSLLLFSFTFSRLSPRQNISRPPLALPSNHQQLVSHPHRWSAPSSTRQHLTKTVFLLFFPSVSPFWTVGLVTFKPQSIPALVLSPSVTSSSSVYNCCTSSFWPDHLELQPPLFSTNVVT